MKKNKHLINKLDGKENTSKRYSIEKNDCTVRAYAEAFDIEYSNAHTKLMMHGRQIGHGVVFETFMSKHHPDIRPYPCPHMTVAKFVYLFGKMGTWIIKIRGHVFCVKGNVIFDQNPEYDMNCHVKTAWLIKPNIKINEVE